jgi:hypothetical protein
MRRSSGFDLSRSLVMHDSALVGFRRHVTPKLGKQMPQFSSGAVLQSTLLSITKPLCIRGQPNFLLILTSTPDLPMRAPFGRYVILCQLVELEQPQLAILQAQ